MECEKIKKLMDDMSNSTLTSIDISFPDGTKISMKKEKSNNTNNNSIVENKLSGMEESNEKNELLDSKLANKKVIKSSMVGTFYLRPSPDSAPYVTVGESINKGSTVCIIEAMKLMNEIESEYSGVVKEILVKDGESVAYGTDLFVIE